MVLIFGLKIAVEPDPWELDAALFFQDDVALLPVLNVDSDIGGVAFGARGRVWRRA